MTKSTNFFADRKKIYTNLPKQVGLLNKLYRKEYYA